MKWRKSPQELIDVFQSVMPKPPAVPRQMFGYPAAFLNGNMFMALFQDDMILRLPEGPREELLQQGAKPFEPMPGRPMREYVAVPAALLKNKKQLAAWVAKSLEYGASLKPKPSAKNLPSGKSKVTRSPNSSSTFRKRTRTKT